MKKIVGIITAAAVFCIFANINPVMAENNISASIEKTRNLQEYISNIGYKILNSNKIETRMVFMYSPQGKKVDTAPELRKRQIIIYDNKIQFANNDDEIAAMLSREICKTAESYVDGKGMVTSAQVKMAPKKYEIFFDKRAVDFMVNAGYNPLGMITYIHKTYPQKRQDKVSRSNLTSKRLANIYEYIYTKYPYYFKNNEYLGNEAYQNFLLTSVDNRKKLQDKVRTGSKKEIKYE
jgi:hypothetical protein